MLNHEIFGPTLIGSLVFSLIASAVYITNDLVDLKFDSDHPIKRYRPIAANQTSRFFSKMTILTLLVLGLTLSFFIGSSFFSVLIFYLSLSIGYSFLLKKIKYLDIICLTAFYLTRILAGHILGNIPFSIWLSCFSTFFLLSISIIKRHSELICLQKRSAFNTPGRAYSVSDINTLRIIGVCSASISIIILAVYILSNEASRLYSHPSVLWFNCIILSFILFRAWILSSKGNQELEEPVLFALKDSMTIFSGFLIFSVMFFAK